MRLQWFAELIKSINVLFNYIISVNNHSSTGIDNGERLAAPGIVWQVFGKAWEVLFTGSVGWKQSETKNNKRSHKLILHGPHFVFVRDANLVGSPISWESIQKFHVQIFFLEGEPMSKVNKADMAAALLQAGNFLTEVKNCRIWSDIKLVLNPSRNKKRKNIPAVPVVLQQNDKNVNPSKRASRRLMAMKTGRGEGLDLELLILKFSNYTTHTSHQHSIRKGAIPERQISSQSQGAGHQTRPD